MVASRSPSVYAGAYRIVIVVAATLIAALAPITNAADEFSGDVRIVPMAFSRTALSPLHDT